MHDLYSIDDLVARWAQSRTLSGAVLYLVGMQYNLPPFFLHYYIKY